MTLLLAALLPALSSGPPDAGAVKLPVPKVEYRINEASASRSPWIDANGWQLLREPARRYYYDVPAASVALAAAEAFAYGAKAAIHTDTAGEAIFHRMLQFLREIPEHDLPAMANIGIIDDGSPETGELMNLLTRRNLLYRIGSQDGRPKRVVGDVIDAMLAALTSLNGVETAQRVVGVKEIARRAGL